MPYTIVQVSDTHLSETHAYFVDNWAAFTVEMKSARPDLIINSGDFSFNGPDKPDDLRFCHDAITDLGIPYVAIPGNHDVGEPGDNPRLKQPVNDTRLGIWNDYFGPDHFVQDIEEWRLVGINSEILGSGLPAEAEQWTFLEESFAQADGRALGLFIHKPLFEKTPDEPASKWSILPEPRAQLLEVIERHGVRFVGSGHLHRYRHITHGGVDLVWCPTTAFITPSTKNDDCIRRVGYLKWTFTGDQFIHEMIEPEGFTNHDMTWRTKTSGTTIALPPHPLNAAE